MQQLGKKLQTLRKNKNITQEQLAEVLSVSSQAISKWENNQSTPAVELLPVIARYFGITMDELFNYRLDALNYKERFIRFMVDNGVVKFGQFQLHSGRISPYYIDTNRFQSGEQIAKLGEFYAECIRENNIQANVLWAESGKEAPIVISTGMILYQKYGMPIHYCINRREEGTSPKIMGKKLESGDEVVVIEDILTSGGTLRGILERLQRAEGVRVRSVVVFVDRMERGKHSATTALRELEQEFGIKIHPIVTLEDMIHAMENGVIVGGEYLEAMKRYRENYGGE